MQQQNHSLFSNTKDGRYANIDVARFETNQGVTEALDTATGETVIVKAILLQNASHWKSTQQEAATLRELDHANVVRFIDFLDRQTPDWAEFGAMSFIIMEHCAGGSLVDWIEKMKGTGRRTTMDEARIIGAQIISGLSYCHGKNKVHLDLKPANIFIFGDNITVKIGDFGSALTVRSIQQTMTTTSGEGIKSTPLYAAPEINSPDETAKKHPTLDVWGFALIIQEIITLEHPFARIEGHPALFLEILTNIQTGKRTSLFEMLGETDEVEEFETLIEKCTRVDRTRRPRNAIELRNEAIFVDFLQRIENGDRASSIVPPPFPNENDEVERLKGEIVQKDRMIQELRSRLDTFNEIMEYRLREQAKKKDEQIALQNRKNEQQNEENGNLKRELAKMKKLNSELEQNFEYSRKIIDDLKMRNEAEMKKRENEMQKAKREIERLHSILKEEKERNRRENENQKKEIERFGRGLKEQRRNYQPIAENEEKGLNQKWRTGETEGGVGRDWWSGRVLWG
ncbi:Oidioi.mRNA.OKI2018_I69.PAR.g13052.t1.cds [Oikopleura dioica]|uniref:Oidioi.mRNA.OKI2018_I69.PAR.g13052.t1.cds n=1 Tax=Oikopleura dioica TaxID=34765 RepID=A0ABN7S7M3_OIKDI|nr:Oidioi.mRNA.OKI2018_I69.PAR.g13052.t1.cds [Oikopleura dioica]